MTRRGLTILFPGRRPMTHLRLFAAGSNGGGQLGTGSLQDQISFAPVLPLPCSPCRIKRLAAGANHTLLLLDDGTLFISGRDRTRSVDHLLTRRPREPREATFERADLSRFSGGQLVDVACVWETSILVFRDACKRMRLFSLGAGDKGELGRALSANDEVAQVVLDPSRTFVRAITVATGPRHAVVLYSQPCCHEHEALYGWGVSRHGQLGPSLQGHPYVDAPHRIETFFHDKCWNAFPYTIACAQNATLMLWHCGSSLHLTILSKSMPGGHRTIEFPGEGIGRLFATWKLAFVLTEAGRLHQVALTPEAEPEEIKLPLPVIDLACGSEHAIAILADTQADMSEAWAWGWNEHGNLGTGDRIDATTWVKLTPPAGRPIKAFAGNGTSWLVMEQDGE